MEQEIQYGQQNFTLPHDVMPLPSQGLFYKNKKKAIKVGYLTAHDENILLSNSDDMTLTLLRNKIFLRNTSFGPEITLNLTDPVTKRSFQATASLEELPIVEGEPPNEEGCYVVTLPKSGASVKLKPLSYGEAVEITKTIQSYPAGRIPPAVTLRLTKQIIEVNGSTNKGEIARFVEQLPIADSKFIKTFMNENEPRLNLTKTFTAPSGEKLTVDVGFGVDFFRPFF
jgi:hypothetical protein